ncbi:MAG TPA: mycofactocin precursor, partial [Geobacter sp.]|nr:mycofactocin precursor [Geobacter sp.]
MEIKKDEVEVCTEEPCILEEINV